MVDPWVYAETVNLLNFFQKYEIYIGDSANYSENTKVPGGPFLDPYQQSGHVFDQYAYDAGADPAAEGWTGYVWPFGKENWVNLQGKYIHIVSNTNVSGTASFTANDLVDITALSVFGTKYVRDDALPTALTVMRG